MVKKPKFYQPWSGYLTGNKQFDFRADPDQKLSQGFFITAGPALCEVCGLGMLFMYSYRRVFHNAARWINCNKAYRKTKNANDNSMN